MTVCLSTDNFVAIGDVNPDFNAGLYNTFSYKGLSLSFLFDWKKGGDVLNLDNNYMWFYGTSKVTEQGRETPFVVPNSVYASNGSPNTTAVSAQDYWPTVSGITESNIEDGSYIKLRTLSLAYTVSTGSKKLPFKSLTFSVGATISGYMPLTLLRVILKQMFQAVQTDRELQTSKRLQQGHLL